jgi:DNA invertase Pin-like site-specific DNA recombinase
VKTETAGTQAQEDAIKAWAAREQVEIAAWHFDLGVSGGLPPERRPGLSAAFHDIKELNAGVLIVAKLDRLARDMQIAGMVEALMVGQGVRVLSAQGEGTDGTETNDPGRFLMRSMIQMFAQYERLIISFRTTKALQAKQRRGERTGSVPFGKKVAADKKTLVDCVYEQNIIASVKAWDLRGFSRSEIAGLLPKNGMYPRKAARDWHPQQIKRILEMPAPPVPGSASDR